MVEAIELQFDRGFNYPNRPKIHLLSSF